MYNIDSVRQEWQNYFTYKKRKIKKIWKLELEKNIAKINSLSGKQLDSYIKHMLELKFDYLLNIPIEEPRLLDKVIEYYKQEYPKRDTKLLIWLYKSHLFNGIYNIFGIDYTNFLREALSIERNSKEALELLYTENLNILDYATHELPYGLCLEKSYCLELIKECEELEKIVTLQKN